MKVGEAIAATLVAEGVDTAFSLLGDANMEVLVALAGHGVRIVECRHEAAAMAMADGYARASGRLGLCAVTAGPALAHTFTPLTSAVRIGSPVVVLTGPRARDDPAERQNLDHQGLARLTGAGYLAISNPDTVVERVRGVVDQALSTRTPVVLDVPIDLQKQEHPWPVEAREAAAWQRPQRIAPDPAVVAEAARILAAAERPVLIAGEGAVRSGARAELLELGERTGALLATALNARGWFDGEEFDAGVAGLYSRPEVVELFTQADCVVSFGASMNRYTTMEGYLFPEAAFVQVDIRPPAPMPSGDVAACYVQADALRAAQGLLGALDGVRNEGYRTDDVAKRLRAEPDTKAFDLADGELDPRALCAQLDRLLPGDVGWVSGNSGHFWGFPILHMPRRREPMLFATYFGAIGYGIPVAAGAAIGSGQPVVAFEGDASLLMHLAVLETMARARAHVLVVVMNDRALGAELHKMNAHGHDPTMALTPEVDVVAVSEGLGCPAVTVTDLEQLPAVVGRFVAGDGPLVLDARLSRQVISLPFRRLFYGEW